VDDGHGVYGEHTCRADDDSDGYFTTEEEEEGGCHGWGDNGAASKYEDEDDDDEELEVKSEEEEMERGGDGVWWSAPDQGRHNMPPSPIPLTVPSGRVQEVPSMARESEERAQSNDTDMGRGRSGLNAALSDEPSLERKADKAACTAGGTVTPTTRRTMGMNRRTPPEAEDEDEDEEARGMRMNNSRRTPGDGARSMIMDRLTPGDARGMNRSRRAVDEDEDED
jgi:hypothetical protein